MPCLLFKDISKTANDILNDDYNLKTTLKVKTKTANGVTFTTEGAMGSNKAILAKLSSSFTHKPTGVNISKLQYTTHGRMIGEASLNNALFEGLKLSFKAEDGALKNAAGVKYKPAGKIGAEYKAANFSATADADFANNAVSATGVFGYENFVFGGQAAINVEKSAVSDQNVALSYSGADFHASILTKKNFGVVSASMDHKACTDFVYAAILDHDVKSQANSLTVGGRYKSDAETTFCGKVNSEGIVTLACVQKLKPMVTMTTTAQIDAKNIEGESHKFGMGLTLG